MRSSESSWLTPVFVAAESVMISASALVQYAARQKEIENLPIIARELRRLAHGQCARTRQIDVDDLIDPAWTGRHDDDPVRQEHRFGHAVGDEQNRHPRFIPDA